MTTTVRTDTIPGPPAMPLLGWRGSLLRFLSDPLTYLRMLQRDYGLIARVAQDSSMIFAFGPEHNRRILSESDLFHTRSLNIFPTPEGTAARRLETVLLAMNGAAASPATAADATSVSS